MQQRFNMGDVDRRYWIDLDLISDIRAAGPAVWQSVGADSEPETIRTLSKGPSVVVIDHFERVLDEDPQTAGAMLDWLGRLENTGIAIIVAGHPQLPQEFEIVDPEPLSLREGRELLAQNSSVDVHDERATELLKYVGSHPRAVTLLGHVLNHCSLDELAGNLTTAQLRESRGHARQTDLRDFDRPRAHLVCDR